MQTIVKILGRDIAVDCAECDVRRLEDLSRALESRLGGFGVDEDDVRKLVLTALSLMDEVQATSAALVRARCEIERLTDMVVEAKLQAQLGAVNLEAQPLSDDRGRVGALRPQPGAA